MAKIANLLTAAALGSLLAAQPLAAQTRPADAVPASAQSQTQAVDCSREAREARRAAGLDDRLCGGDLGDARRAAYAASGNAALSPALLLGLLALIAAVLAAVGGGGGGTDSPG